jgi:hypothetical protein
MYNLPYYVVFRVNDKFFLTHRNLVGTAKDSHTEICLYNSKNLNFLFIYDVLFQKDVDPETLELFYRKAKRNLQVHGEKHFCKICTCHTFHPCCGSGSCRIWKKLVFGRIRILALINGPINFLVCAKAINSL